VAIVCCLNGELDAGLQHINEALPMVPDNNEARLFFKTNRAIQSSLQSNKDRVFYRRFDQAIST
jgi:hypothetical protein